MDKLIDNIEHFNKFLMKLYIPIHLTPAKSLSPQEVAGWYLTIVAVY